MVNTEIPLPEALITAPVERPKSSFYWAMRLLGAEKRNAMYAVYAFCRIVDDIADNPGRADDKRAGLQIWRRQIGDIFAGDPAGPIGLALVKANTKFGLDQEDFLAVIDGMEMDVGIVRITDMAELELYCDRVAVAVGRISNRIFGLEKEAGDRLSESLGRALQLTNILRDLMEDAAIDRLYLPLDMLQRHGIAENMPLRVLKSSAIAPVCNEIAAFAGDYFAAAESVMSGLPPARLRPARIMKAVYEDKLRRLTRRGWADLERPVGPSRVNRLFIALRHGLFGP